MNPWNYICICPCEFLQLELLDLHAYTCKYTYTSYHRYVLYKNPCFANSHLAVPMRTHIWLLTLSGQDTPRPWLATNLFHLTIYVYFFLICMYVLYLHIFLYIYICIYWFFLSICVWVCVLNSCWDILVIVVFSKTCNLTLSILS